MKRRSILLLGSVAGILATTAGASCSNPFPAVPNDKSLMATLVANPDGGVPLVGTISAPLPLQLGTTIPFTFNVAAIGPDGGIDTTFNGYVRAAVQPGNVLSLSGPPSNPTLDGGIAGRNVLLQNGVANGVTVNLSQSYGEARVWFEDIGYEPADPLGAVAPECSNGIDDNNNGLIDYPAEPGCYAANDNSEDGGSFASAESDPIYIALPRIADVRGYNPPDSLGTATAFPDDQVVVDTGYRFGQATQPFSLVVTNVTGSGIFVQDLQEDYGVNPPGFNGIYAYSLTPQNVNICDKLTALTGTSSDYYGYTELNYPTWQVQPWSPAVGPCSVPAVPNALTPFFINNQSLFQYESTLVRIGLDGQGTTLTMPANFGPLYPPLLADGGFGISPEASNCDFNGDGKIEFNGGPEQICDEACTATGSCSDWVNYESEQEFTVYLKNNGSTATILANVAISLTINPPTLRGQPIGSITGNLMYFSGGTAWTVVARCDDDIVADPNGTPIPGNQACTTVSSGSDNNNGSGS